MCAQNETTEVVGIPGVHERTPLKMERKVLSPPLSLEEKDSKSKISFL